MANRKNNSLITTTYQLPADLHADFKKLAREKDGRTARAQIRQLVESYVKRAKAAKL